MSEGKPQNLLEKAWDTAQRFWPVSLFLMALTLLSRFEDLKWYSQVLAYVVDEWRVVMHLFWDFVINVLRNLVGLVDIRVPPPWPEVLTFVSFLASSFRSRIPIASAAREVMKKLFPSTDLAAIGVF